jgi:hypothetical protein
MPEPTTGIAAFSAVAGVAGARSARKDARSADRSASAAEAEALDFAKQQYADWKSIFGPIQQNMSAYYQNLTPGRIEAQGREAIELERDDWMTRIDETFQQRGLGDTAMEASAMADVERNVALQKAEVRATAPEKVAQQQMSFLTLGYNQNPAGAMQQVLSNTAASRRSSATYKGELAGKAIGSAVTTVGTALGDYYNGGEKK